MWPLLLLAVLNPLQTSDALATYDVRAFGAKGDGIALDSPAINRAIDAAKTAGGGTILLPAGAYRSFSIHLRSNISLEICAGATLVAADSESGAAYDVAEDEITNKFQDYGHSHFHNSLIWGENLVNVSICGHGQIYGKGLVRDSTKSPDDGNKAIALLRCRNVIIRDVTIRHGGWFAILATGIDHLTVDNLLIDTNRDGMDIDCCRDVHVSNCTVNSPHDDGICLKSSYALNESRACENVSITNCHVSGYDEGSVLDGTYAGTRVGTGRIKFGTESNGGFKNVAISNCVFDHCCGFALESVDGALLEDVTVSNITMRDIANAPIFLRLGRRMRGPHGVPVGKLRRVSFGDIRVVGAREGCIVAGVPGYPVEDVSFSGIRIQGLGGAPAEQSANVPKEQESGYPEPGSFGKLPAYGFFIRHAKGLQFRDITLSTETQDGRPPFVLDDVNGADFFLVNALHTGEAATFNLKSVASLRTRMVDGVPDAHKDRITGKL